MKKYEFPIGIHSTKLMRSVLEKTGIAKQGSKLNLFLSAELYKHIFSFLRKEYGDIIDTYATEREYEIGKPGDKIWTCWWQGEDNAPPLVKRCLESIRKNADTHEVVVINKENISDFIDFPSHIIEKYEAKMMPGAIFADSIRATLLAEYGGLWLDATIFCFREIPEKIWQMPLYTTKPMCDMEKYRVLKCSDKASVHRLALYTPYTVYSVLGGYSGHPLYCFLRDVLDRYWRQYSSWMAYHLSSCIMKLAYNDIARVNQDTDAIPVNDSERYALVRLFRAAHAYDKKTVDKIADSDTLFYKMTWKDKFKEYADTGEETAYKRFLEGTLV